MDCGFNLSKENLIPSGKSSESLVYCLYNESLFLLVPDVNGTEPNQSGLGSTGTA